MKRQELLDILKLASPALLGENEAVLPILKSLKFTGTHVIASNDVIAVCLTTPVKEAVIVPGRKLISFLNVCNSKTVKVSKSKKTEHLLVDCASSRLRLSIDSEDEWPFEFPDVEQAKTLSVNENFFEALALCSSRSSDTGIEGWLGSITFVLGSEFGVYGIGRDRVTISYCRVEGLHSKSKVDQQVVVPSSFCKAAVSISEKLGQEALLHIAEDTVVLDWGDGENILATKLVNTSMPDIRNKFYSIASKVNNFIPIEDSLGLALKRASVIGKDSSCRVTHKDGGLRLLSKGIGVSLNDKVKFSDDKNIKGVDVRVPADLICQQFNICTQIAFSKLGTVMQSSSSHFTHVIANRT